MHVILPTELWIIILNTVSLDCEQFYHVCKWWRLHLQIRSNRNNLLCLLKNIHFAINVSSSCSFYTDLKIRTNTSKVILKCSFTNYVLTIQNAKHKLNELGINWIVGSLLNNRLIFEEHTSNIIFHCNFV